jgi:transposase-like protein
VLVSCPQCRSKDIRRSRRKGFLESSILSLILLRPFRCQDCNRRFYRLVSPATSAQSKSVVSP